MARSIPRVTMADQTRASPFVDRMNAPAEFADLRQLTASDAEAFSALRRAVTAENPVQMGLSMEEELGRSIESFRAQLSAPAPSAVLGAFVDAQLVATAAVSPAGAFRSSAHKMVMWGVFTHPAFRRRGLCRALVSAALDHACHAGVRRVNLLVYLPNDAAVGLYRSLKFVEFGREPEAIQLQGACFDGLHMSLAAAQRGNAGETGRHPV